VTEQQFEYPIVLLCDFCHEKIEVLDEDDALIDIEPHGWSKWKSAQVKCCFDCQERLMDEANYPPCDECETQPCEKGRDCWAEGRYPIHILPYETYYAARVSDNIHIIPGQLKIDGWMPP